MSTANNLTTLLSQVTAERDALQAKLAESQIDVKVGYRLYDAAEQRVVELRGEVATLLAERDALQSMLTVAQRFLTELYDAASATVPGHTNQAVDSELAGTHTLVDAFALTRRRRDRLREVLSRIRQHREAC